MNYFRSEFAVPGEYDVLVMFIDVTSLFQKLISIYCSKVLFEKSLCAQLVKVAYVS